MTASTTPATIDSSGRHKAPRWAFPALIGCAVMLSFGAMFVRLADTGPVATGFWRMALALPLLGVVAAREGRGARRAGAPRGLGVTLWMPVAAGVFFALDIAAWHLGIPLTRLANATLFGNSATLFLAIYGMVLARRLPRGWPAVAILLAAAGTAVLMGRSLEVSRESLIGDALCLFAGFIYTGYVVTMQRARAAGGTPWQLLFRSTLATAPILLLVSWALGERLVPGNWAPLILLALSSQVIGQGLMILALPYFSPLVVGLSLLLQPVIAAVAGLVLFDERLGAIDIAGAVMIAVALVLVRLPEPGQRG